jgi:hypothetical protein
MDRASKLESFGRDFSGACLRGSASSVLVASHLQWILDNRALKHLYFGLVKIITLAACILRVFIFH